MKIYTRKGDDGTTGLWYGGRVAKSAGRPEAYGSVDEAASALGVARAAAEHDRELYADILASRTSCSSPAPSWRRRPRRPAAWRPGVSKVTAGDGRPARAAESTATWTGSTCRPSS